MYYKLFKTSFIGVFWLVICSVRRPMGDVVNGMDFNGFVRFLTETKTQWLFIVLVALFVLSVVAFGYGVAKTFFERKGK